MKTKELFEDWDNPAALATLIVDLANGERIELEGRCWHHDFWGKEKPWKLTIDANDKGHWRPKRDDDPKAAWGHSFHFWNMRDHSLSTNLAEPVSQERLEEMLRKIADAIKDVERPAAKAKNIFHSSFAPHLRDRDRRIQLANLTDDEDLRDEILQKIFKDPDLNGL